MDAECYALLALAHANSLLVGSVLLAGIMLFLARARPVPAGPCLLVHRRQMLQGLRVVASFCEGGETSCCLQGPRYSSSPVMLCACVWSLWTWNSFQASFDAAAVRLTG